MKFCSFCGADVILKVPQGDTFSRFICTSCETIHYQNPNNVVGVIPEYDGKILLCERAIEPRTGTWTFPAGFMENGETTQDGAAREAMEEANARLTDMRLFGIFNIPHISQVYIVFTGKLVDGMASPGPESLDCKLYAEDEIPWEEISFPVIHEALTLYYQDKKNGTRQVHLGDVFRDPDTREIQINRY